MKRLFITLFALLTCATAFAQSVIVKGTGADAVRGTASAQVDAGVFTNLVVTGTLTPDVTGSNYVHTADRFGHEAWYNSDVGHYIYKPGVVYRISPTAVSTEDPTPDLWYREDGSLIGEYLPAGTEGTATVAYGAVVTNVFATAIIQGKATP